MSNNVPGESFVCSSVDRTVEVDEATRFPVEFFNSLEFPGSPPHRLYMKLGMPLILLRNLNPKDGLANGTRLTLLEMIKGIILKCVIGTGDFAGRIVLIPRISTLHDCPIPWRRRQFPVRVASQAMEVIDSDDDLALSQIDSRLLDNTILTNSQTCESEKVEPSSEKKDEVVTIDNTISDEEGYDKA